MSELLNNANIPTKPDAEQRVFIEKDYKNRGRLYK
jgi:hypothetical protein